MRGKLRAADISGVVPGITPACAGKTFQEISDFLPSEDHPRVCGENEFAGYFVKGARGSPPRVRGKPAKILAGIPLVGITPACAGKTTCVGHLPPAPRDHPRVCGENWFLLKICGLSGGSPPRVRGKPRRLTVYERLVGITPACAGKTASAYRRSVSSGDHPRVCGENAPFLPASLFAAGSPPRVRGKH